VRCHAAAPSRPRAAAFASAELTPPSRTERLLRCTHTHGPRILAPPSPAVVDYLPADSHALEIGRRATARGTKSTGTPSHAPPNGGANTRRCMARAHPNAPVCRFRTWFHWSNCARRPFTTESCAGKAGQAPLVFSCGTRCASALHFYKHIGGPDFTTRDVRLAEALQPHFHTALSACSRTKKACFAQNSSPRCSRTHRSPAVARLESRRSGSTARPHTVARCELRREPCAALKARRAFRLPRARAGVR